LKDFIITSIDFDSASKKVVSFCVLQIYFDSEKMHEIIKFDAAHGKCHVHKNYLFSGRKREELGEHEISQ
jgi:hypothetical protein